MSSLPDDDRETDGREEPPELSSPRRPLSDRQREWLDREIAEWSRREILSRQQITQIWDLYIRPEQSREQRHAWLIFGIMGLAAVLVGLAALLLVGYNWREMSASAKLVLTFGAILAAHGTGVYLRFFRGMRRSSEIACFLGCLFYGAGIGVVADVFPAHSHYPDGVWLWALGVLPLALCFDTILFHLLSVGLLGLWVTLEVTGPIHVDSVWYGLWRTLPQAAWSLPLLAAPGLILAYHKRSALTVGLYAALFGWWIIWQPLAWDLDNEESWIYVIGSLGALYLLIAECHRVGSRFAIPYRLCGLLLAGGALVPMSFAEANEELIRDDAEYGVVLSQVIFLVSALVLGAVGYVEYQRGGNAASRREWLLSVLRRQWLPFGLTLLMAHLALWGAVFADVLPSEVGVVGATILVNAAMIAFALWLMAVGIREDRGPLFAAGVAYLLLWAAMRYFDLFSDFGGVLGAAILFFLCGAALFGLAFYWRRRRDMRHV